MAEQADSSSAPPSPSAVDPLTVLLGALALPNTAPHAATEGSAELRALVVRKFDGDRAALAAPLDVFATDNTERHRARVATALREVGADRDQELIDRASDLLRRAEQARPGISEGIVGRIDAEGGRVLVVGGSVAAPIVMGDVAVYTTLSIDPRARQNRRDMLKQVRDTWIAGYLEPTLQGAALPAPDLEVRVEQVRLGRPVEDWSAPVQPPHRGGPTLAAQSSIGQLFDDHRRQLLILGEAGAGKTMLLLRLTQILLDRADRDETLPVPVVFQLADWTHTRRPLDEWLVDELCGEAYQVSGPIARRWVDEDWILPLLDGLDEVAPEYRTACVAAICAFRDSRATRFPGLVVTSRVLVYEAFGVDPMGWCTVVLKPLRSEQIDAFVEGDRERLAGWRAAMLADAELRELAESPLMLHLMSHAYDAQGAAAASRPSSGTQQERRRQLLAMYVDASFARRSASNGPKRYSRAQTQHWLGWLAGTLTRQSQPVLYLDRLQPDWLPSAKALAWYGVVDRLGSGLIVTLASTLVLWAVFALVAGAPTLDDAGTAFLVSLIPGVTAAVLGGAAIPRARRLAGGVPLSRRVILAGLTGGLLGGAAGSGAAALGIPQIPEPDLLPIVEFGLVFGAISSWLACTLSTRHAVRRGLIQRVARRGLAGAVLGAAIGLVLEFVIQAFNFADTHAVGIAESSWTLIASAPRWVPALEWPNAFSNQSIVGCLYGLALGVLGALLARGRHAADSHADRGRFLRGAAAGALLIGAVGAGVGELLTFGGGFATQASPLIGLLGAVIGGLAGGLAGGPGRRGRHVATAEPVRWSTRTALRSGFTGLWSGLWIGMLGGGLAFGFFGWLGVSASDPLKSRFNLELIVGGPYSAVTLALTGATVVGVELGLMFAVAYGLTRGFDVGDVAPALAPNQGVWRSARRAMLTGLWSWGVVTAGLLLASGSVEARVPVSAAGCVWVGLLFGLAAALALGGYACLSHMALRVVLWRAGVLPLSTVQFLDYATERTFLRRVGGGYVFRHALLQEYLASSSGGAAPAASGADTIPARPSVGLARALLSVVTVAAVFVAVILARLLSGVPTSDGPLSAADYVQRADAAWHSRNYAGAEQDDTRAIALQPDSAAAYNLRALIRASAGRPEEALVDANQAVALCQAADCTWQSDLLDTRGYVYLELARYQSAARDYEQILDSGFRYPTAVLGRGLAYAGLGRNRQALDDLEALVRPAAPGEVSDPQLDDLVLQARQTRARLQAESAN